MVAGLFFIIVVTTLVDIVLHAVRVFPPIDQPIKDDLALLATAYRIVISIAGAWLTARLAPDRPMKHVLILGLIGTVLGIVGGPGDLEPGARAPVVPCPARRARGAAVLAGWQALRDLPPRSGQ